MTVLPIKSATELRSQLLVGLDKCGLVCKHILIAFNILLTAVGFALLVFGMWLNFRDNPRDMFDATSPDDNKEHIELEVFDVAVHILVIVGSVKAALGIFGEYAACNESKVALNVFCVLLFLLAAGEITVGALAYTDRDTVGKKLGKLYEDVYKLCVKNEDEAFAAILTSLHRLLPCCGVPTVQLKAFFRKTCPKVNNTMVDTNCPETIEVFYDNKAPSVTGLFAGIGVFLIVQVVCSSLFSSKIHRDSEDPE